MNIVEKNRINKDLFQIFVILNYIPSAQKEKIPKEIYDYIVENMEVDSDFKLNSELPILEQNFSPMARAMFVRLYSEYITEHHEKWENFDKVCNEIENNKKEEKYNSNDIFKNVNVENIEKESISNKDIENNDLIEYKEKNIFQKILEKIIKFLKLDS